MLAKDATANFYSFLSMVSDRSVQTGMTTGPSLKYYLNRLSGDKYKAVTELMPVDVEKEDYGLIYPSGYPPL